MTGLEVPVRGGMMEVAGPIDLWLWPENDAAIQNCDDRLDIYMGLSKVVSLHFVNKRDLNRFLKNGGEIELRRR